MKKVEKKEKQGIERFIGMSWKRAMSELKDNTHLLVLTDKPDERATEVAITCRDHGIMPALAALCSHLYIEKHGAAAAAHMAAGIYQDIYHSLMTPRTRGNLRKKAEEGSHELRNLEHMLAFTSVGVGDKNVWPLEHKFTKRHERGGLANILMFLAARELAKGGTCEQVAAFGIQRFLDKGRNKKK